MPNGDIFKIKMCACGKCSDFLKKNGIKTF